MGTICGAVTIRDETIAKVLVDPRRWPFVDDTLDGSGERTLPLAPGEGLSLFLDKAWHGLHYLLTGTDWAGDPPENFILCGGIELRGVFAEVGSPRALTSVETRAASEMLTRIDEGRLRARFDPYVMTAMEISPSGRWGTGDDGGLGYLLHYANDLRVFLRRAVACGMGIVISLE